MQQQCIDMYMHRTASKISGSRPENRRDATPIAGPLRLHRLGSLIKQKRRMNEFQGAIASPLVVYPSSGARYRSRDVLGTVYIEQPNFGNKEVKNSTSTAAGKRNNLLVNKILRGEGKPNRRGFEYVHAVRSELFAFASKHD